MSAITADFMVEFRRLVAQSQTLEGWIPEAFDETNIGVSRGKDSVSDPWVYHTPGSLVLTCERMVKACFTEMKVSVRTSP